MANEGMVKYTLSDTLVGVKESAEKLEDGTTKIFLNMTSRNGSRELISLLQYMRKTDINNPNIIVKDERLVELDRIVTEVRESEEWEEIEMDLIDIYTNRGISQGELKKLIAQISRKKMKNYSTEETADMLETEISLVQKVYDALERYDANTQWRNIMGLIQKNP